MYLSKFSITVALLCSLFFAACSTYDSASHGLVSKLSPYRAPVVQGNFISRESVAQLKLGMSKEQVRFLLGTPLLNDVFHADRWDYIFTYKRGDSVIVQQRRYTVYFDADKLVKFEGDELPSEYELVAEIDGLRKPSTAQAAKDTSKDASKNVSKDAPKDAPKDVSKDAAKDEPKDSASDAPK